MCGKAFIRKICQEFIIHTDEARANYKYSSLQLPSWPSFRKDHLCLIGKVWWKAMKNV